MSRKAATMMLMTANRRRDDRGRYMTGDDDRPGMHYGGEMRYMGGEEMRYRGDDGRYHAGERRNGYDGDDMPRMGGEGRVIWDRMPAYPPVYLINNGIPEMRDGGYNGGESLRQYGRRYNPDRTMTMADTHREMSRPMIGFGASEENESEHRITLEKAKRWVDSMVAADGTVGGRWTYEDIKRHAANFGLKNDEEIIEFFAVINAMYSDYCLVAQKFGANNADFFAELAKAWMHDKDAIQNKTAMYMDCIAMHE